MSELITFRGETNGTSTSGTVSLWSDILNATATYVRIPKGMKAKIWFKKVSGDGETAFTLQYTSDVTAGSPSWSSVEVEKLTSKGEMTFDRRRPVILRGLTGKEAFQITWTQPTACKAYIELGVELSED